MRTIEACEKCEMLRNANEAARNKLISHGLLRTYEKNETIFMERQSVNRIYFVVSGYVALYKMNQNHDRKIIFVYGSGELLNEPVLEKPVATVTCYALRRVEILSFSREQFQEALHADPHLNQLVIESLCRKVRRLYHQLGNTTNMVRLEKQVAAKLWKLGRDFGVMRDEKILIDFDMSITFLADMVGSKRETVSRVLKILTDKGLIQIQKPNFYICDMDSLKAIVSECK